MKIYCCHNNTGSRYYRLIPQLKYMKELGHQVILEPHDDKNIDYHIAWADVVIFQMVLDENRVKICKKMGKVVIFDCDDLIHIVPPTHYEYKNTKGLKNRFNWWKRLIPVLIRCDGFISTNEFLDKKYGRFSKNSLVFDNYLSIEHWLKGYRPNTTDEIRLLWAGSTSHTGDLHMIKPVLDKTLRKFPQVKFIYIGTGGIKTNDLNARFIYGDDMFEGLPSNRESMLAMTGKLWPYILSTLMADIAIAPLEKNYFNKFKSNCKVLEYGINKIPAVYSGWKYKDSVVNGVNGYLANSEQDWLTALSILIKDKDRRTRMGEEAYKIALKKDIKDNLYKWQGFVEKLYGVKSSKSTLPSKV